MAEQPHFGQWFRRVREKLGITQRSMAAALQLDSYVSVRNIEKRPDRSVRGTTLEQMLELLGYPTEQALDLAWRRGEIPPLDAMRVRMAEAQAMARGGGDADARVRYNERLMVGLFNWLAAHPPGQLREMLKAVPKPDAAAVARALVDRVTDDRH